MSSYNNNSITDYVIISTFKTKGHTLIDVWCSYLQFITEIKSFRGEFRQSTD